jgi:signal transduction histidine kinase
VAAELAHQSVESYRTAAEGRGVKLDLDLPDGGDWSVRVDRQRVGLVFDNLIGNALKYTPAGGTIRVGAMRDRAGGHFFVTDTGRGIAMPSSTASSKNSSAPRAEQRQW